MRSVFRGVSILEGLSLITLFFIAMPAKYYFDNGSLVPVVGMAHGVLWLVYVATSLSASHVMKWSVVYWLFILVLSLVPFGFLWVEFKVLKTNDAKAA